MIPCHDDQGVVEFSGLLQESNRPGNILIKAAHLEVVIRHVTPHLFAIREEGKEVDLFTNQTALSAGTEPIGPVRVGCPEPETKRRVFGFCFQELFESLLVARPSRVTVPTLQTARTPAFPPVAHMISGRSQEFWVDVGLWRKNAPEVRAFLEAPVPLPGQDRVPRWSA